MCPTAAGEEHLNGDDDDTNCQSLIYKMCARTAAVSAAAWVAVGFPSRAGASSRRQRVQRFERWQFFDFRPVRRGIIHSLDNPPLVMAIPTLSMPSVRAGAAQLYYGQSIIFFKTKYCRVSGWPPGPTF